MIALLQRVSAAQVRVDAETLGTIDRGLLVFLAIERLDTELDAQGLAERVLGYRVFEDSRGRMHLSVRDLQASVLGVPQFTLAADTAQGLRPSFTPAAPPELGKTLYDCFVENLKSQCDLSIATGRFGANMQVELVNDGPVTFWLQTK